MPKAWGRLRGTASAPAEVDAAPDLCPSAGRTGRGKGRAGCGVLRHGCPAAGALRQIGGGVSTAEAGRAGKLARALLALLGEHGGAWSVTAGDLLALVQDTAADATGLAMRLGEAEGDLAAAGVMVERRRQAGTGARVLVLRLGEVPFLHLQGGNSEAAESVTLAAGAELPAITTAGRGGGAGAAGTGAKSGWRGPETERGPGGSGGASRKLSVVRRGAVVVAGDMPAPCIGLAVRGVLGVTTECLRFPRYRNNLRRCYGRPLMWRPWAFLLLSLAALTGCSPFVEVVDLKAVPEATRDASMQVRIIPLGMPVPAGIRMVGPVEAYSCKALLWDPPATQGNALQQLQLKALKMGADAVVNVAFDLRGTDQYGTNCWQTVTASGFAAQITNSKMHQPPVRLASLGGWLCDPAEGARV